MLSVKNNYWHVRFCILIMVINVFNMFCVVLDLPFPEETKVNQKFDLQETCPISQERFDERFENTNNDKIYVAAVLTDNLEKENRVHFFDGYSIYKLFAEYFPNKKYSNATVIYFDNNDLVKTENYLELKNPYDFLNIIHNDLIPIENESEQMLILKTFAFYLPNGKVIRFCPSGQNYILTHEPFQVSNKLKNPIFINPYNRCLIKDIFYFEIKFDTENKTYTSRLEGKMSEMNVSSYVLLLSKMLPCLDIEELLELGKKYKEDENALLLYEYAFARFKLIVEKSEDADMVAVYPFLYQIYSGVAYDLSTEDIKEIFFKAVSYFVQKNEFFNRDKYAADFLLLLAALHADSSDEKEKEILKGFLAEQIVSFSPEILQEHVNKLNSKMSNINEDELLSGSLEVALNVLKDNEKYKNRYYDYLQLKAFYLLVFMQDGRKAYDCFNDLLCGGYDLIQNSPSLIRLFFNIYRLQAMCLETGLFTENEKNKIRSKKANDEFLFRMNIAEDFMGNSIDRIVKTFIEQRYKKIVMAVDEMELKKGQAFFIQLFENSIKNNKNEFQNTLPETELLLNDSVLYYIYSAEYDPDLNGNFFKFCTDYILTRMGACDFLDSLKVLLEHKKNINFVEDLLNEFDKNISNITILDEEAYTNKTIFLKGLICFIKKEYTQACHHFKNLIGEEPVSDQTVKTIKNEALLRYLEIEEHDREMQTQNQTSMIYRCIIANLEEGNVYRPEDYLLLWYHKANYARYLKNLDVSTIVKEVHDEFKKLLTHESGLSKEVTKQAEYYLKQMQETFKENLQLSPQRNNTGKRKPLEENFVVANKRFKKN